MNSLSVLANELHEQAVADFKVSERYAYGFIMKVKRIRDERLYKELGYTSFESYCESAWNVKRDFMDERILLAESFGENFDGTYRQLGHTKSLLLARMEPEMRKQVESTIDVNEATVKQLKEAQRQIEEAERKAQETERKVRQQAEDERRRLEIKYSQLQQQYERDIERMSGEIDALKKSKTADSPETLQRIKELEQQLRSYSKLLQKAEQELEAYKLRDTSQFDEEEAQKQLEKLRHEADRRSIDIRIAFKSLNNKVAVARHLAAAISASSDYEKKKLREEIQITENIIRDIKLALGGRLEMSVGGN